VNILLVNLGERGAHAWSKDCAEVGEAQVAIIVYINQFHHGLDLILTCSNMNTIKTLLEITIGDITVTILIKLFEQLIHLNFAMAEHFVFNLVQEPSDFLVMHVFI